MEGGANSSNTLKLHSIWVRNRYAQNPSVSRTGAKMAFSVSSCVHLVNRDTRQSGVNLVSFFQCDVLTALRLVHMLMELKPIPTEKPIGKVTFSVCRILNK